MVPDDGLRSLEERARPAVIAQAGPEGEDLVFTRLGKVRGGGEAAEKPFKIRNHGLHPGLLQHDLGNPDPVGSNVLLPGQAFTAMLIEPGTQSTGKILHVT